MLFKNKRNKEAYKLPFAVLMKRHGELNDTFWVVEKEEYKDAIKDISDKKGSYCLMGFIDNNNVVTDPLVKVKLINGNYHGYTKHGEHYVW